MNNDLETGLLSLTSIIAEEINNFFYENQTITKTKPKRNHSKVLFFIVAFTRL